MFLPPILTPACNWSRLAFLMMYSVYRLSEQGGSVQRENCYYKKLKIELPYDSAIPLLGIYSEKTITWKDMCTPMFTAALYKITITWKQPKYHQQRGRSEDVVYIYNRILFSHKKGWNNAICSNMNAPRDFHAKWSRPDKDISDNIIYMWNKNDTNELMEKTEIDPQT